jgi:protein CWC15
LPFFSLSLSFATPQKKGWKDLVFWGLVVGVMTTAHRPTWNPAKGGNEQGGFRLNVPSAKVSARDLPGHLTLKERGRGQGTAEELQTRDLKRELEEKEQRYRKRAKTDELELVQPSTTVDREPGEKEDDLDADVWLDDQEQQQQQQEEEEQDAQGDKIDEEASEDDDEEEDELLKELERIKREREEERRRKEEEVRTTR